jgi:hypothetical protein
MDLEITTTPPTPFFWREEVPFDLEFMTKCFQLYFKNKLKELIGAIW